LAEARSGVVDRLELRRTDGSFSQLTEKRWVKWLGALSYLATTALYFTSFALVLREVILYHKPASPTVGLHHTWESVHPLTTAGFFSLQIAKVGVGAVWVSSKEAKWEVKFN